MYRYMLRDSKESDTTEQLNWLTDWAFKKQKNNEVKYLLSSYYAPSTLFSNL